jgi:3'5'-cyclic nucleotide phosphodiesterase
MGGAAADLSTANLARIAVAITNQPWDKLGLDGNDDAAASAGGRPTTTDAAMTLLQLRGTAILMTRLAAMAAPPHVYANLATSTIGKTILADFIEQEATTTSSSSLSGAESKRGAVDSKNKTKKYSWPGMDNGNVVVQQVHRFVGRMFQGYKQVPYHNQEHAFHVLQSITKLIDLMITGGGKTFGLKHDPLALFALVFAALIHDVEHQGIPVRCYYGQNV